MLVVHAEWGRFCGTRRAGSVHVGCEGMGGGGENPTASGEAEEGLLCGENK